MSRGTSWSIYRVDPHTKSISMEDCKEAIARGYKEYDCGLLGFGENASIDDVWMSVPDVVQERWLNGDCADKVENLDDKNDRSVYTNTFYRKSDGAPLSLIGTWDFNSTSLFVLDDILGIGLPKERIISADTAKSLLDAIEFCLTAKKTRRNKGDEFAKAVHSIRFVDELSREGLCPLPSTVGERDCFMLEEESHLMRLRDILNAFFVICCCEDYPYTIKNEYVLTCGYWG